MWRRCRACTPVWVALLRIVGCDTCITELAAVQGPVAAACGAFTTLDACTSEDATAAARLVLCGDDPACARISPNTIGALPRSRGVNPAVPRGELNCVPSAAAWARLPCCVLGAAEGRGRDCPRTVFLLSAWSFS